MHTSVLHNFIYRTDYNTQLEFVVCVCWRVTYYSLLNLYHTGYHSKEDEMRFPMVMFPLVYGIVQDLQKIAKVAVAFLHNFFCILTAIIGPVAIGNQEMPTWD